MELLRLCKMLHYSLKEGMEWGIRQTGIDLTPAQLDVLMSVAQGGGEPVNQRDIEEQLRLSNPTVTGILKRLEKKGFVTRTVGKRDRRCKEVRLTEKCAALGEQLRPQPQEMLGRLFEGFTPEEFDTINSLILRLLKNYNSILKASPDPAPARRTPAPPDPVRLRPPQAAAACPSGMAR